jgi:hypothetical protein
MKNERTYSYEEQLQHKNARQDLHRREEGHISLPNPQRNLEMMNYEMKSSKIRKKMKK